MTGRFWQRLGQFLALLLWLSILALLTEPWPGQWLRWLP